MLEVIDRSNQDITSCGVCSRGEELYLQENSIAK